MQIHISPPISGELLFLNHLSYANIYFPGRSCCLEETNWSFHQLGTQDTSPLNYITQRFKNGYDEDTG